jgi:autotransporter-associated beta strand protein
MADYTISSGVVSSGLALEFGDTAVVLSGGKTVSASDGGVEIVAAGGSAVATTVLIGGEMLLDIGGVASDLVVSRGGAVYRGGLIDGAAMDLGVISGALVGGSMTVGAGGVTENVTVVAGGVETIAPHGLAGLAVVASGGELIDDAVARHATILAGGLVTGSGRLTMATLDAGRVDGMLVVGPLTVASGGLISGGAVAIVGDVIGSVMVASGGQAIALDLEKRTSETIASGGVSLDALVASGAVVTDDGALVFSGAPTVAFSGVLAGSGAVVEDGPGILQLGGSTSAFTGAVRISGGTVALAASEGAGGGEVVWTASSGVLATLKIDAIDQPAAGSTYATTLSNFDQVGDGLYMASLVVSSGATAVVSGTTLKVTNGALVYDFTLAGSASTAYAVVGGPLGGLLVKAVGGSTVALAHAMAAFGATPAGPGAPADAGVASPPAMAPLGGSAAGSGWRAS